MSKKTEPIKGPKEVRSAAWWKAQNFGLSIEQAANSIMIAASIHTHRDELRFAIVNILRYMDPPNAWKVEFVKPAEDGVQGHGSLHTAFVTPVDGRKDVFDELPTVDGRPVKDAWYPCRDHCGYPPRSVPLSRVADAAAARGRPSCSAARSGPARRPNEARCRGPH